MAINKNMRQILLILDTTGIYGRALLLGLGASARTHGHWRFLAGPGAGDLPMPKVQSLQGDGIIVQMNSRSTLAEILASGIPAINVSARFSEPGLPSVVTNSQSIGKLAANHFIERGFQNFAYLGFTGWSFSEQRRDAFRDALRVHNPSGIFHELAVEGTEGLAMLASREKVREWLQRLPKPIAILAANDHLAIMISATCQLLNIHVPEGVAILGIDNDPILCEFADPPLSSIDVNISQVGFRAATLLNQRMAGESVPAMTMIEPLGVVTRQSSDVLSIEDTLIASAIRFIRANAHRNIQVEDILSELKMNRRALERRFRRAIGRSPAAELRRHRIEIAKRLLSTTDQSMADVASASGFLYPQHMAVAFRQIAGVTPSDYRQQFQKK